MFQLSQQANLGKELRLEKLLQIIGLAPNEDEKALLKELGKSAPKSMRVVGRGTLVMDAREARQAANSEGFIEAIDRIVS